MRRRFHTGEGGEAAPVPSSPPGPDGARRRDEPSTCLSLISVERSADRAGWAVVVLAGAFVTPVALGVLRRTLIDLLAEDVDTVTVDASRCAALSPAACRVLVDAARHTRRCGGCLVASGLGPEARLVLACYDVDHRLHLARTR